MASIRSHTANRKTYILLSHNHTHTLTQTLTHCGPGLAHYTRQNWLTLICYTHSHNLNIPSICSNSVTRRVRPNGNRVGATSPAQWQQQAGTTGYDYVYACERVCVNVTCVFLLLVTHSAAIISFIYSNFHLLLFARVPLSFVGLFSPYVPANPMYADTHTQTRTPTLTNSLPWRVASCHAPTKAVYALCAIERPNAMVPPSYKA